MKFSVIIPTFNDWKRLMRCLNALKAQTLDRKQFEVIVVNNNKDGEIPSGFEFPNWTHFIHESKAGSYNARNRGVEKSTGELIAFTDSDCIPDENWLANAKKSFSNSTCDLVGGEVQIFQDDEKNKYGYLYERVNAFPQHKSVTAGKGVTANLFVKKAVFDRVDGFDSNVRFGGDWEFTQSCVNKGYKIIYCKDVLVLHPARTVAGIFKKQKRLTCGGALMAKQKYGHSNLRLLGSHLIHGLKHNKENITGKLTSRERVIVYLIDMLKYFYRAMLYSGMLFRLVDLKKIRE